MLFGKMYFLIRGTRIALSLFSAMLPDRATTKRRLLARSIPPKSQIWLSTLPLSYFLLVIRVSSISTSIPSSPMGFWFLNQAKHTSGPKSAIQPNCYWKNRDTEIHRWLKKRWTNSRIFHTGIWVPQRWKVPLELDTVEEQYISF